MPPSVPPHPLRLYKASAGSGKTFRLAVEYIKLLIEDPSSFRHILAVTFTNKATSEMKQRILSQLYGIAQGLKSSDSYLREIRRELRASPQAETRLIAGNEALCRQRAGQALTLLLQDYSYFRVETIDSYFQSILREVARELMLPGDFRVEITTEEPLRQAVQELFDTLPQDADIYDGVVNLLHNRILEQQNWQIKNELETFGKQLFNERFLALPRQERARVGEMQHLTAYRHFLTELEQDALARIGKVGASFVALDFVQLLSRTNGGPHSLIAYCSDPAKWLLGFRSLSATLIAMIDNPARWLNKAQQTPMLLEKVRLICLPLLAEALDQLGVCLAIKSLRNNLDALSFVGLINRHIKRLNEQEHRFLLSDTAHLLSELIAASDIPFIYERTGVQLSHIMIDEFQDTSYLQWQNFLPLVKEATSAGNACLIVGDVKQSIYRWRNSDWSILNNLDSHPTLARHIEPIEEHRNFRSGEVVVRFNNAFFKQACEWIAEEYARRTQASPDDIRTAYTGMAQEPLPGQQGRGFVCVQIAQPSSPDEQTSAPKTSPQEDVMTCVADALKSLFDKGVPPTEVAILTRTNDQISALIDYLSPLFPHVSFVSNEAYKLEASGAVQVVVQALRVVQAPADRAQRVLLAALYHQAHGRPTPHALFAAEGEELDAFLPDGFSKRLASLARKPLYSLCETIIELFELHTIDGQEAYLIAFLDMLFQHLQQHTADIDHFLDHWEHAGKEKPVPMGRMEGVQLLTIHKAKGLEYHSVIVPLIDLSMSDGKSNILWVPTPKELCPPEAPDELPFAPINYSVRLSPPNLYAPDYAEEMKRLLVDNLNLLYVAFTRARQNLFVIGTPPPQKSTGIFASSLLTPCTQGEIAPYEAPAEKATSQEVNPMTWPTRPLPLPLHTHTPRLRFRQGEQARRFFLSDDGEAFSPREAKRQQGLRLHLLLSRLRTRSDIPAVAAQAAAEGLGDSKETIEKALNDCLSQEGVRDWFAASWRVLNERTILAADAQGNPQRWRPDRVITDGQRTLVIDYKTGRPRPEHREQVNTYMQLLSHMGYPHVEGRLWYISSQTIISL